MSIVQSLLFVNRDSVFCHSTSCDTLTHGTRQMPFNSSGGWRRIRCCRRLCLYYIADVLWRVKRESEEFFCHFIWFRRFSLCGRLMCCPRSMDLQRCHGIKRIFFWFCCKIEVPRGNGMEWKWCDCGCGATGERWKMMMELFLSNETYRFKQTCTHQFK